MSSILLADDVALAREGLARALRERGHRVQVVVDGQEAVAACQRDRPDLAILDVTMPRLGGLEACARIKATAGSFVPVIIMSARTDLDSRLAALAVAEDFVPKPYDPLEMCARVDAHLRTRKLVEEQRAAAADTAAAAPPVVDRKSGLVALGGLPDRAGFLDRLGEEWKRSVRTNDPLGVLVAGVDSPVPGEGVMGTLAGAIGRSVRSVDVLARIDERHIAGMLQSTHLTGGMTVADRLRRELRKTAYDGAPLVVSLGFSFHPGRDVTEPADLLRVAERALARAREEGPGHICLWQHQGYLYDPAD